MSSIFVCSLWPFLLGALIGWLANWLMYRSCCKSKPMEPTVLNSPPPPVAKIAEVPKEVVSAPLATTKKATLAEKPKVSVKSKTPTKPKTTTKPKAAIPKATTKPKASIDIEAAKAAGFSIKSADDLTVIEGIGPKINDLFKTEGLKTFAQVAKATVPQMRDILDKGGSRFRIANPGTWAQQAALAENNNWVELKKLQDELSAGIKK
jgi:predicted flap endonuclease-1-like 5' DNA nuclease